MQIQLQAWIFKILSWLVEGLSFGQVTKKRCSCKVELWPDVVSLGFLPTFWNEYSRPLQALNATFWSVQESK